MAKSLNILNRIKIASPCPASWSAMRGDDRVRYCERCKLNVYNLSAMTEPEIVQLIVENEGKFCGAIFRRPDGTAITKNCPVGLRLLCKRLARLGGGIAAMFGLLVTCHAAIKNPWKCFGPARIQSVQPWRELADSVNRVRLRLFPPPPDDRSLILGGMRLDEEFYREFAEYERCAEAAGKARKGT